MGKSEVSATELQEDLPSTTSIPPLLEAQSLGKQVGQRWIWHNINLSIWAGSRWGLVGPSGSGKSLLMRSLAGLVPIDHGEIRCRGQVLSQWQMPHYRSQVCYLPQHPSLYEGTVADNLRSVFTLKIHRDRRFDPERIMGFLQQLGRSEAFLSLSATTLSGGEGQILGLLRVLQVDPLVLLLDEPTASLDPETTHHVETLIETWLQSDPDRACLWTSHSREQISRVSDHQFTLEASP